MNPNLRSYFPKAPIRQVARLGRLLITLEVHAGAA